MWELITLNTFTKAEVICHKEADKCQKCKSNTHSQKGNKCRKCDTQILGYLNNSIVQSGEW